jgi:CRP/FNR family transcriptional regulator, cyclic AMP receptor protein
MSSMDDMDFTKPQAPAPAASAPFKASHSRFYDPKVAATVFKSMGKQESFAAGQKIFMEDEKASRGMFSKSSARVFYLERGEVALTIGPKHLDVVKAGEIFGEMAVITGQPRSASATARAECVTFSVDAIELELALARNAEFALMLASVMYDRLRFLAARLASRPRPAGAAPLELSFFSPQLVAQLDQVLPRTAVVRYPQQTLIFKEGQAGKFMYVVKQGRVGIAIGGQMVEIAGPGGVFGEMAVVDQSPRTTRAGAIDECELIAMDRDMLLHVIRGNAAFAMALLRAVAERLRHMNAQLR